MKKKLIISVILVLLTAAFAFRSSTPADQQNFNISETGTAGINKMMPPAGSNISSNFLIGAMDGGADISYNDIDDLGLNLWHKYLWIDRFNDNNTQGWDWYEPIQNRVDNLYNTYNVYSGVVTGRLGINEQYNMRTLMQRPKTELLAFGQRSDYQCESTNVDPNLWFYAFNNHDITGLNGGDWQDNTQYGSNQWVRRCLTDPYNAPNGQGYVVRRLMTNSEQCNTKSPIGPVPGDNIYDWYIKPSIRADKNFIDNHDEDEICRIEVINYNGNTIKSVILRAKHFKNTSGNYDGNYKEVFNFAPLTNQLLIEKVSPYTTNAFNPNDGSWGFNSRGNSSTDGSNKMDIKVYWYGTCDMWIDYVRVDNDVAHRLLKGNDVQFEDWLQWEASLANTNCSPIKFYIEEFEFNHIPCMSYVSRKLRDYSLNPNFSLMSMVNLTQYNLHLPYYYVSNKKVSAEHISEYLLNRVGESQVLSEPYALTGKYPNSLFDDSKVPNTLMNGTYTYDIGSGRLGEPASPGVYDAWLQEHLDADELNIINKKGYYTWYLKTMDTLSKMNNIPHINMPQTHLWYDESPLGIEECLREPTNEELEMTTLIPVTYGARGTFYFWYGGFGCIGPVNEYARGLVDPIPCNIPNPFTGMGTSQNVTFEPRYLNVYNQPKWEKVKIINQKLTKWSPYLMSFDNTNRHSYIYRLERNELISQSYFRDLYTFKPGSGNINCLEDFPEDMVPPENTIGECKEYRYLQVATFENPNESRTNYFMIVNRRCSPFINGNTTDDNNGGRRFIVSQFNPYHNDLAGANYWRIINVADNSVVQDFDKMHYHAVNFGWFQPGEGRLYKMVPVTQSGGILAGDEVISGGSFTCEAPVYNNGHNITIEAGTTIHFNDSSRFVMNGGVFTVGNQNVSGSQNITFDAVNGTSWLGHSFTNCEVKIYGASFSGITNDTAYSLNIIDCPVVDIRNCTFNSAQSLKGAVNAVFYNNPFSSVSNVYL